MITFYTKLQENFIINPDKIVYIERKENKVECGLHIILDGPHEIIIKYGLDQKSIMNNDFDYLKNIQI